MVCMQGMLEHQVDIVLLMLYFLVAVVAIAKANLSAVTVMH